MKIEGWEDAAAAKAELVNSVRLYEESEVKPAFWLWLKMIELKKAGIDRLVCLKVIT